MGRGGQASNILYQGNLVNETEEVNQQFISALKSDWKKALDLYNKNFFLFTPLNKNKIINAKVNQELGYYIDLIPKKNKADFQELLTSKEFKAEVKDLKAYFKIENDLQKDLIVKILETRLENVISKQEKDFLYSIVSRSPGAVFTRIEHLIYRTPLLSLDELKEDYKVKVNSNLMLNDYITSKETMSEYINSSAGEKEYQLWIKKRMPLQVRQQISPDNMYNISVINTFNTLLKKHIYFMVERKLDDYLKQNPIDTYTRLRINTETGLIHKVNYLFRGDFQTGCGQSSMKNYDLINKNEPLKDKNYCDKCFGNKDNFLKEAQLNEQEKFAIPSNVDVSGNRFTNVNINRLVENLTLEEKLFTKTPEQVDKIILKNDFIRGEVETSLRDHIFYPSEIKQNPDKNNSQNLTAAAAKAAAVWSN